MTRRFLHAALMLTSCIVFFAANGNAQTVRGVVLARETREPVSGGIIALLDSTGRVRAATMGNDSGRFVVNVVDAGSYRVRVERVGFRSFVSPSFVLGAEETRDLTLEVASEATALRAIRITADKRCVVRPKEGLAAAELWNEARKALDATRISQAQRSFGVRFRRFERELDPFTLQVKREESFEQAGDTRNPFVAVATNLLERHGFARTAVDGTMEFYAPDADVLLSDFFLDTHCLMTLPPIGGGQIGLAFEPIAARKLPEVKGVLWFDPRTFELRAMQYQYVNLAIPSDVPRERLGGRLVFTALPNGHWMVRQWSIRMPLITEERLRNPLTNMPEPVRRSLAAIKEAGGEVLDVLAPGGAGSGFASVTGIVYDSVKLAPLRGSRVFLSGTPFAATTDAAGRFTIDSVPPGPFTLSLVELRLDTLQLEPPSIRLTLSAGERKTVNVGLPSFATLLAARCTGVAISDSSAAILGVARDELTGKPAAGAIVRVNWQRIGGTSTAIQATEQVAEATVAPNGRYAVCGLPADSPVTVRVVRGKARGTELPLRTIGRFIHRVDLRAPAGDP